MCQCLVQPGRRRKGRVERMVATFQIWSLITLPVDIILKIFSQFLIPLGVVYDVLNFQSFMVHNYFSTQRKLTEVKMLQPSSLAVLVVKMCIRDRLVIDIVPRAKTSLRTGQDVVNFQILMDLDDQYFFEQPGDCGSQRYI